MLTTAGQLLFAGDTGNIIGYDAANGKPLWHAYLGANVTNPPQTYALDGHQYMLTAAGETLFAFRPE